MADEKWTVVGRRRGSKLRSSSSSPLPPSVQSEECDEALLLLRLKRSMARVEESAFFQRLLFQVQNSPVLDLLSRAALTPYFQSVDLHHHHQEVVVEYQARAGELLDATRFSRENIRSSQDMSSVTKILTSDNSIDGATACFSCTRTLQVCKCSGNTLESASLSALTKTCNGRNLDAMACESISDALFKHTCQTYALQGNTEQWCLHVVLYGLGSIADSEVSRCQLALILLLKQRFSWVGIIEVYDPVLSHSECNVIEGMGCLPLATDEKGRRSITVPTLFYMPHCEEWLYDNVLQANWLPHILGQIVILGNSFQDYQERWSSPVVGRKRTPPSYLLQYQQVAKEVPLESSASADLPGFNDLSWHFYDPCNTPQLDDYGDEQRA